MDDTSSRRTGGFRRWAPTAVALLAGLALAGCGLPGTTSTGDPAADAPQPAPVNQAAAAVQPNPVKPALVAPRALTAPTPTPDSIPLREADEPALLDPLPCHDYGASGIRVSGLQVEPGPGAAQVSWRHTGRTGVRSYKVAAVPAQVVAGAQAPPRWQAVPAPAGCHDVTADLPGLQRSASYEVWLVAVTGDAFTAGTTREIMVGRKAFRTR